MTQEITHTPSSQIDKLDRHGYLFGHGISHSMSPLLHQTIYDNLGLRWGQIPLDSTDMSLFLKLRQDPKFYGKFPLFRRETHHRHMRNMLSINQAPQ